MTPVVVVPRAELSESDTTAVGQKEEAAASVRGTHVRSSNADGCSDVAVTGELGMDGRKSASCSADVLPREERRVGFVGDSDLLVEESRALSVEPGLLPCDGEVLARSATNDAIHDATPRAAVEGADVVPDRSRSQGRVRHPCHETGRSEGFPLDVHHSAGCSAGGPLEPEVDASASAADGDGVEGTKSHIHAPLFLRERTMASRCALASRS